MLSSEVAQSLKRYGHFSDVGVEIALSHRHGEDDMAIESQAHGSAFTAFPHHTISRNTGIKAKYDTWTVYNIFNAGPASQTLIQHYTVIILINVCNWSLDTILTIFFLT